MFKRCPVEIPKLCAVTYVCDRGEGVAGGPHIGPGPQVVLGAHHAVGAVKGVQCVGQGNIQGGGQRIHEMSNVGYGRS